MNQADTMSLPPQALTQIPTQASLGNNGTQASLGNNRQTQSKPDVSDHGNGDNNVNIDDGKSVASSNLGTGNNAQSPIKEVEIMRQKSFDLDGALSPL